MATRFALHRRDFLSSLTCICRLQLRAKPHTQQGKMRKLIVARVWPPERGPLLTSRDRIAVATGKWQTATL